MNGTRDAGWIGRLRAGLGKSRDRLGGALSGLFTKRRLDARAVQDLEDVLIQADLGVTMSARLAQAVAKERFDQEVTDAEVKAALAEEIARVLEPVAAPIALDPAAKPHVVLVAGVNGSGKTTTIGKLAAAWRRDGLAVTLVAGDTFRAAAVEQLQVWGQRADCPVVAGAAGADAAGLAFGALETARTAGTDVLMVDTAGRLQNRKDLMAELQKVVRVIKKQDPAAPHTTLLVMDATIGQNALDQVATFRDMVAVSGLVLTKLDGSAKGGVVVALADRFGLPVHAVGVGEAIDDLRPFAADQFARALVGLED